jgi:hypothetical protein
MILYKYMSNRSFLENLKVRFTPPNQLNDPRELCPRLIIRAPSNYALEIINRNFQSALTNLLASNPEMTPEQARHWIATASSKTLEDYCRNDDTIAKKMHEIFMKTTCKNIGVFSLTETDNNELMWAHYANNHAGYVVGFDTETNFFSQQADEPNGCGELMNVIYSDDTPTVYVDVGALDIPKELFFTKTTKWKYEREWRMIRMLKTADTIVEQDIHLYEVPPESIVSVAFGLKFPKEDRRVISASFPKRVPHVNFMNASYNHRNDFIVS